MPQATDTIRMYQDWQYRGVSSEPPVVLSVNLQAGHRFSKTPAERIDLVAGLGVQGDGHAGVTVQHRSRVRRDPTQPNLRQVHLLHAELFDQLAARGFEVEPGELGENVTTRGIDLLSLPTGTLLRLGHDAVVRVTGLRNPCVQIDGFRPGLLRQVLDRDERGNLVRKAGIMGVVLRGGQVATADPIAVEFPAEPHRALGPV